MEEREKVEGKRGAYEQAKTQLLFPSSPSPPLLSSLPVPEISASFHTGVITPSLLSSPFRPLDSATLSFPPLFPLLLSSPRDIWFRILR